MATNWQKRRPSRANVPFERVRDFFEACIVIDGDFHTTTRVPYSKVFFCDLLFGLAQPACFNPRLKLLLHKLHLLKECRLVYALPVAVQEKMQIDPVCFGYSLAL